MHEQRLAEAAAQPEPEPELPPADSEPETVKAALATLTEELAATPLHDDEMREHLQSELDYYEDLQIFYKDDWKAIYAQRRQAERAAKAEERKAKALQVHPEARVRRYTRSADRLS